MTQELAEVTELPAELHTQLAGHGFRVSNTPPADQLNLQGPLTTTGFVASSNPDGPTPLAVAVVGNGDLEQFDAVVAAVQSAAPDLAPTTPVSVQSVSELVDGLPEPTALYSLLHGDVPIGIIARHDDRRRPIGESGSREPGPVGPADDAEPTGLSLLQDVLLDVSVELGRSSMPLAQLMSLGLGSVVELDRAAGAPVDVRVNGMLFARGDVVVVDGEYAVRLLEILASPRP